MAVSDYLQSPLLSRVCRGLWQILRRRHLLLIIKGQRGPEYSGLNPLPSHSPAWAIGQGVINVSWGGSSQILRIQVIGDARM